MFGLESIFFKVLGTGIYTERIYSLTMFLIAALLLVKIWSLLNPDEKPQSHSWFPVLLWMIVPVVYWAVIHNVEENTMAVFVLGSFIAYLKIGKAAKGKILWLFFSGFLILAAGLCKGVQGMFPLSMPFFAWLVYRRYPFFEMAKQAFVLAIPSLLFVAFAITSETISASFELYFDRRIVNTFNNEELATTTSRLYLTGQLFNELLPPLILASLVVLFGRKRNIVKQEIGIMNRKHILFLILVGLSGTLPLLVTLEQRRFYLVTPMPFFILAIGLIALPYLKAVLGQLNPQTIGFRRFRMAMVVILLGSVAFAATGFGKTKRDEAMLHDVKLIGQHISPVSAISVDTVLWEEWVLHAYFNRYHNLSLLLSESEFVLAEKGNSPDTAKFRKENLKTRKYDLFKRR